MQCEQCGYEGEAAADPEDMALAAGISLGDMLRWQMMARVVPEGHPLRARIDQATAFYTPRNLWILWQTLRMLELAELEVDQRRAIQWLIAQSLWKGSHLCTQPGLLWQPTLRRTHHFFEPNLWHLMHQVSATAQEMSGNAPRTVLDNLNTWPTLIQIHSG